MLFMATDLSSRYINLFTDFGFKRIFGTERNKDLLIDFLNNLLDKEMPLIRDLQYMDKEQLGKNADERRAVFDLFCESEQGDKFIIELQKAQQRYFKDRSLYYASFAIQVQGQKGKDWNYTLQPVYSVSMMDFVFEQDAPQQVISRVELHERNSQKLFHDKLFFVFVEMPKFNKSFQELNGNLDQWLYVFKNIHRLDKIPDNIREGVLLKLFQECEISNYNPQERMDYEKSLKEQRDWQAVLTTAKEEGIKDGLFITALNAIKEGCTNEFIHKLTGLPVEEIEKLRKEGLKG